MAEHVDCGEVVYCSYTVPPFHAENSTYFYSSVRPFDNLFISNNIHSWLGWGVGQNEVGNQKKKGLCCLSHSCLWSCNVYSNCSEARLRDVMMIQLLAVVWWLLRDLNHLWLLWWSDSLECFSWPFPAVDCCCISGVKFLWRRGAFFILFIFYFLNFYAP